VDEDREPGPGADASDDELYLMLRDASAPAADRRRAFEILFDRWYDKVHAWCRKVLGDPDRAADRAQEVFVDLLEKPLPFGGRKRFGSWLYVIARNRCLNEVKRESRRAGGDLERLFAEIPTDERDPAEAAVESERSARVRRACATALDAREQEIVYLRYHWGLKVDEITERLRLENASGARTYLRNAEAKLRKALAAMRERPGEGGGS
jgi:RNA polymerase sigma-70 factor (ECF subfamily)